MDVWNMPHATLSVTSDGYVLPVVVGWTGQETAKLLAAGQPVPKPIQLQGEIDTGSNITCIVGSALARLGLTATSSHTTHTVAGPHRVQLFEVSFGIPCIGALQGALLVLDHLVVMEWTSPPPGIEALVGRDVLDHLLMLLDGPRQQFTLAD
jgi:hypothetical protein